MSQSFDLSATAAQPSTGDSFTFLKPITITFRLSTGDLALARGVESNIVVQQHKSPESGWIPLPTTVDLGAASVRAQVDSLSIFALTIKGAEPTPSSTLPPTSTPVPTTPPSATVTATSHPTTTPTLAPSLTATAGPVPPSATPTLTSSLAATSTPVPLTATPTPTSVPGASPERIAFASARDGDFEIYAMSPDGSGVTRLTRNPGDDRDPSSMPDGTRIAFASSRDGNFEIYVMDRDGSNQTRLTTTPADDRNPAWSQRRHKNRL